jgi:hypothetical protein
MGGRDGWERDQDAFGHSLLGLGGPRAWPVGGNDAIRGADLPDRRDPNSMHWVQATGRLVAAPSAHLFLNAGPLIVPGNTETLGYTYVERLGRFPFHLVWKLQVAWKQNGGSAMRATFGASGQYVENTHTANAWGVDELDVSEYLLNLETVIAYVNVDASGATSPLIGSVALVGSLT